MRPGPFVLAAAGCATLAAARPVAAQEADQPAAVVQKAPAPPAAVQIPSVSPAPYGFYRDGQGRVMQVSFDLQRRLWLGVAYSPRRRPTGDVELSPAAFDFGASWEGNSPDGRTRHRLRFLDGEVRLHPYGLALTAFRYDMSHHHERPLLRITTLWGEPERHDLHLDLGIFTEALRFDVAPRGLPGEYQLTLASVQATLDLWQSVDLRSYVRVRLGPAVETRLGPWGDETRFVAVLPQTTLEGNVVLGRRSLQQVNFRLRGEILRSLTLSLQPITSDWRLAAEGTWEAIFVAVNDQPVSLRVAGQAALREEDPALAVGPSRTLQPARWEWTGTVGLRMSFFTPPVVALARR